MTLKIESLPVPLRIDEGDAVRVGRSRVTLDTVVYQFRQGATPEEILQNYPTLDLGDIYAVCGYYLKNQDAVDAYILHNEREAAEILQRFEQKYPTADLRKRLLARRESARQPS